MGSATILSGIAMQVVACAVLTAAFVSVTLRSPRPWNRWWAASFAAAAVGLAGAWAYYRFGQHVWVAVYGPVILAASVLINLGLVELIDSRWWRRSAPPMAVAIVLLSAAAAALMQPVAWFTVLSLVQTLIMGTAGAILVAAVRPWQGRWMAIGGILLQIASHLFYLSTHVSGLDPTSFIPYGLVVDLGAELLIGTGLLLVARDVEQQALAARNARLQQMQEQLVQLSEVDPLTGAGTRHVLRSWFESWDGATPFSILILDIDGLDAINRRHGREAGDEALKMVYDVLQQACTERDLVVRWNDDEFLAVLQDTGESSVVRHLARLMRLLDDSLPGFPYPTSLRVSWGMASCRDRSAISKALAHAEHQMQAMKARRGAGHADS